MLTAITVNVIARHMHTRTQGHFGEEIALKIGHISEHGRGGTDVRTIGVKEGVKVDKNISKKEVEKDSEKRKEGRMEGQKGKFKKKEK